MLYEAIVNKFSEESLNGWTINRYISWSSCVYFQNPEQIFFDIRTARHSDNVCSFQIELSQRGVTKDKPLDKELFELFVPEGYEPTWDDEKQRLIFATDSYEGVFKFIEYCLAK